ncbi:MAG: peptidylprolyl isomerase [Gammaproteobacteria bacterium]|jgi:parvulin-like peptidyl-prolyl isomerase
MTIAKIDDQEISADDLVKYLKLHNKFEEIIEEMILDRVATLEALRAGVTVADEQLQETFDNVRRLRGLHRARDTIDFINNLGMTLEEFQTFLHDNLCKDKLLADVQSEQKMKEYFDLHSPRFDSVEIAHMVLDSEGKAREIMALLEDDPDSFAELTREHSMDAETRHKGGALGKVMRGSLVPDIEARIFNSEAGGFAGPFPVDDGLYYEIFQVTAKHPATFDASARSDIQKTLYNEWIAARIQEHRIEVP